MGLNTFHWQGASGRWYEFEIARAQRAWDPVGGVYMFVKPHDQPALDWGGPTPLFIASTDDFSIALARHDMWAAAEQQGAREIHLLIVKDPASRKDVEKDILDAQTPILNRTLRRVA